MNKLFKNITWLIAPFLCILVFAEFRLRNITTMYENKKAEFERLLPEIDILVIGNSHAENGIATALLSPHAYNLAMSSQSLFYNEKILAKYLPRMKQLKELMITVDYHSLYFIDQELSAFRNDKLFGVRKDHYDHRFTAENLSYFFFVYGALPSLRYLLHPPQAHVTEQGFEPMPPAGADIINAHNGLVRAEGHNSLAAKNIRLTSTLCESIARMIELVQKQHIKVVLVTTPVCETYYRNLQPRVLQENNCLIDSLSKRYSVPYFDFLFIPGYAVEDFSDNDHLSKNGAEKFTRMLHKKIVDGK